MFVSTIIATIGRPTLYRAVDSILSQALSQEEFEIVVVNDSGKPLATEDWQKKDGVRIINTNRRERCLARNTGAALARVVTYAFSIKILTATSRMLSGLAGAVLAGPLILT